MAIKLNSGFEILYFSDLSYQGMTVEIKYKGQQVAQINKDKGVEQMEIEIYSQYVHPDYLSELKFPLNDFLEAVDKAREALGDL
ncbi:hypothetical protein Riv7116_1961 [Rivularia sp. PCC 7116]|uniref:hypothetical protein n=1 Tax=Rivularia sp. PCC 7116 TaxID=373994 RepID=UPI00029EFB02|nr:hypothetical protein [Rivularia sp. PCC 7116]AFY54500.1 hypothetical protein Riv7116_1961 [Rivularia sp. PCC 7116]